MTRSYSLKTVKKRKPRWWWLAEYKCGCSEDSNRKADLLHYCGKHGDCRLRLTKLPAKP